MKQLDISISQDDVNKITREIRDIYNQQMNLLSHISFLGSKIKKLLDSENNTNIHLDSNKK